MKKLILLCVLTFMLGATGAIAATGNYILQSNSGSQATDFGGIPIFDMEVVVSYNTSLGLAKTATTNLGGVITQDIKIGQIWGLDPRDEQVTTRGVEPSEVATYLYDFRNVGNSTSTFNITTSSVFLLGTEANWNIVLSTTNIVVPFRGESGAIVLSVSGNADVLPGDQAIVSISIQCIDAPDAQPYTGDNAIVYGGYGTHEQITTTTILIARITLTKNVSIEAPTGPGYDYAGAVTDPVPGAKLNYTIVFTNIGSLPADNTIFTDDLPYTYTVLTNNVTTLGTFVVPGGEVSYNINVGDPTDFQSSSDPNALRFRVGYPRVGIGETGTINYTVIIK